MNRLIGVAAVLVGAAFLLAYFVFFPVQEKSGTQIAVPSAESPESLELEPAGSADVPQEVATGGQDSQTPAALVATQAPKSQTSEIQAQTTATMAAPVAAPVAETVTETVAETSEAVAAASELSEAQAETARGKKPGLLPPFR